MTSLPSSSLAVRHRAADQEVFGAVFLDTRHCLITSRVLCLGTLQQVKIEPRIVFLEAMACGASAVLLFHGHPTGNPNPSAQDFAITQRLQEAGALQPPEDGPPHAVTAEAYLAAAGWT